MADLKPPGDDPFWKKDRDTILLTWHLGAEEITVPTAAGDEREVGMGLEMSIRKKLITEDGHDPEELSRALHFVRETEEFPRDQRISLALLEQRPEVLTRMFEASRKQKELREQPRRRGGPETVSDLVGDVLQEPDDELKPGASR